MVTVFSRVVSGVAKDPALLDCLNDINAKINFGRIFWDNNTVYIQQCLVGNTLDREELQTAMGVVGKWADDLDEPLAERFGGLADSLGGRLPA